MINSRITSLLFLIDRLTQLEPVISEHVRLVCTFKVILIFDVLPLKNIYIYDSMTYGVYILVYIHFWYT